MLFTHEMSRRPHDGKSYSPSAVSLIVELNDVPRNMFATLRSASGTDALVDSTRTSECGATTYAMNTRVGES